MSAQNLMYNAWKPHKDGKHAIGKNSYAHVRIASWVWTCLSSLQKIIPGYYIYAIRSVGTMIDQSKDKIFSKIIYIITGAIILHVRSTAWWCTVHCEHPLIWCHKLNYWWLHGTACCSLIHNRFAWTTIITSVQWSSNVW